MCQLWALHVVTKRQFFTFIFGMDDNRQFNFDMQIDHGNQN